MRSYLLEEKAIRLIDDSDDEEEPTASEEIIGDSKKKKKKLNDQIGLEDNYKSPPIALLCKVRFETQTRKDIEF